MAVIDTHTHFLPYQWPDLEERYGSADWPWLKHTSQDRAMLMVGEKEFRPVYSACWDIERLSLKHISEPTTQAEMD